jgi:hypothetical protein
MGWHHQRVWHRVLEAKELIMFHAAQGGLSFGEVCEVLCESMSEQDAIIFAASTLQRWIEDGFLAANVVRIDF